MSNDQQVHLVKGSYIIVEDISGRSKGTATLVENESGILTFESEIKAVKYADGVFSDPSDYIIVKI